MKRLRFERTLRKHQKRGEKGGQRGEQSTDSALRSRLSLRASWGSASLGTLWETIWNTPHNYPIQRGKTGAVIHPRWPLLTEGCPGYSLTAFSACLTCGQVSSWEGRERPPSEKEEAQAHKHGSVHHIYEYIQEGQGEWDHPPPTDIRKSNKIRRKHLQQC